MFSCQWICQRVLAILCLTALFGVQQAVASEPVIGVSKSPLSLPLYVAQEQGLFSKHGVQPELRDCIGGVRCMNGVFNGQFDMGTTSELPAVFFSFERSDFAIVATFVTNKHHSKFIHVKGLDKNQFQGLVGKRIGVVPKTSSQYYLDVFLFFNGVDPKSVVQVHMQPEQMLGAMADSQVDAVSSWEPYGYLTLASKPGAFEMSQQPSLYTQTFNLAASKSYLKTHARQLQAILKAMHEATILIREKPDMAREVLKRRVGVDQDFLDYAFQGYRYELSLKQSLITTMESQATWALRERYVAAGSKQVNLLQIIDATHLLQIHPKAVDFSFK